jgi:hypothetical protein
MLTDGNARAGRIEQAHRFIRELASGDVAMGETDCCFDRFVEDLNAMVFLENGRDAANHQNCLLLGRLGNLHHLEAARECRILLDVLLVLGPCCRRDGAQCAARERGLEQVRRITRTLCTAGANERVRFVYEQDDRLR